jgi:hypothetical protein
LIKNSTTFNNELNDHMTNITTNSTAQNFIPIPSSLFNTNINVPANGQSIPRTRRFGIMLHPDDVRALASADRPHNEQASSSESRARRSRIALASHAASQISQITVLSPMEPIVSSVTST